MPHADCEATGSWYFTNCTNQNRHSTCWRLNTTVDSQRTAFVFLKKSSSRDKWMSCSGSTYQLQYAYWQQKVSCRTRSHDIFCSIEIFYHKWSPKIVKSLDSIIVDRRDTVQFFVTTKNENFSFRFVFSHNFIVDCTFFYLSFVHPLCVAFSSYHKRIDQKNVWNASNINSPIFLYFCSLLFFCTFFCMLRNMQRLFFLSLAFVCVLFSELLFDILCRRVLLVSPL